MHKSIEPLVFVAKAAIVALLTIGIILSLARFFRFSEDGHPLPAMNSNAESPLPTIVLDAGHGGIDGGAVSVTGTAEKHLNLAVTKKLGAFLEAAGLHVVYTRTEDEMLADSAAGTRKTGDLLARVKMAKKYENALFISLHMNTLPQEKYHGLQVFYSDENAMSHALANRIQEDVRALLQTDNKREVKNSKNKIYVLDRLSCPAVLVECGFISNAEEAALLETEEYQSKLAFVLAHSILSAAEEMGNV